MSLSRLARDKDLITILLVAMMFMVSSLGYFFVVVLPNGNSIDQHAMQLANIKRSLSQVKSQQVVNDKLNELSSVIETVDEKLNSAFSSADFSSLVVSASEDHSLLILGETYEDRSGGRFSNAQIEILGRYPDIRKFLDEMAQFPFVVKIQKLSLRAKEAGSVVAKIQVAIFHREVSDD